MECEIFFYTNKNRYITNQEQMKCEGIKNIFQWLKDCGGVLSTRESNGFNDITKVYVKWYNIVNQHVYSQLNDIKDIEFKYSIEHKDEYTYEPSYCIECSIYLEVEQPRVQYIRLHFNILLDTNLKVLGIDPSCTCGIIITKCVLQFSIKNYKELLFFNEI